MSKVIRRERCPRCEKTGKDTAEDNLAIYDDNHTYCYSCGFRSGNGNDDDSNKTDEVQRDPTSDKERTWTPVQGMVEDLPDRKIFKDICRLYRYQVLRKDEAVIEIANYFDNESVLYGQKLRRRPKRFLCIGNMSEAGLFGAHLWRHGGKRLIVTEGEIDALAIAQLLKGKWPVVAVPNGASGAAAAIKRSLEFCNSYEEVLFSFDMDDEGKKAAVECADLLLPGKAKLVTLPRKDAADMLLHNETAQLSTALWEAKTWRPDGVIHIKEVFDKPTRPIRVYPFPWKKLNQSLYGQRSGQITMITSGTGMGKSTFLRALADHHLRNNRVVGMLMLEESPKDTAYEMMSLVIKQPIRQIMAARALNEALEVEGGDTVDVQDNLSNLDLDKARDELSKRNLYLYDHDGEKLDSELTSKLNYMAVALGCDIIMLDHISVVVAAMGNGNERKDIDKLMVDLRSLVSRTGIHLDIVSQLRKGDGKSYEEGGRVTLQDLRGSGMLAMVPDSVIAIERNQQHPNPVHADTLIVRSLKDRFAGRTGVVMALAWNKDKNQLEEADFTFDGEGEVMFNSDDVQFLGGQDG